MRLFHLILFLFLASPLAAQTRHALVIGIDSYLEVTPLEKAVNDARAVEAALRETGVKTTLVTDPGQRAFNTAVEDFATSLSPGDEAIFFFAGHGIEDGGQNFLLPADVPMGEGRLTVRGQSVALDTIISAVQDSGARVSVFIIDACRDNPFPQGTRSIGGTRGLAPVREVAGTFVMFSAGQGEAALDRLPGGADNDQNSVFTRVLLPRLGEPGLDLRRMATEVRREVRQLAGQAGHSQFPAVYDQLAGDFMLVPAAADATALTKSAPIATADPCSVARGDWPLVASSQSAMALRAFADLHKACPMMAALAEERISQIAGPSAATAPPASVTPPPLAPVLDPAVMEAFVRCKDEVSTSDFNDLAAKPNLAQIIDDCSAAVTHPSESVTAQFYLGLALDVSGRDLEAADWYRKAADLGNSIAAYNLATMLRNGEGVAEDAGQAVQWYRKAAEAGHPNAMNRLGLMLDLGEGITQNDVEAVQWYRKAAEAGIASAMFNLGTMLRTGEGVVEDDAEALVWYRKSAELGDVDAMNRLGLMLDAGEGTAENNEEAVVWYRKAADLGLATAMFNLGAMLRNGDGVAEDDVQSVAWYRKAADLGDAGAMNRLGLMMDLGEGTTENNTEAVAWYRKAADLGNPNAMSNLGLMLANGEGVGEDDAEAAQWYRAAADLGHPNAMTNLGVALALGTGVTRDPVQAAAFILGGLKGGHRWFADSYQTMSLDPDVRVEIQKALMVEGVYSGSLDGNLGPGSKAAMEALIGRGN